MKSKASAKENSRLSVTSIELIEVNPSEGQRLFEARASEGDVHFVLCINDGGYPESLEVRKFYRLLPDDQAAQDGLLRVVDESGEDYLYAEAMFLRVPLPQSVEAAWQAA